MPQQPLTRRGATLLEVLVALGLALLLLVTATNLIVQVMRSGQRMLSQGALDQTANMTAAQISRDLQRTNASGLTWRPAAPAQPLCLVIHPIEDVNPSEATINYSSTDLILYVYNASARVLERRLFNARVNSPISLPFAEGKRFLATEVDTLLAAPSLCFKTGEVDDFSVNSDVESPLISNPFRFRLRFRRKTITGNSFEEASCIRSVSLRQTL